MTWREGALLCFLLATMIAPIWAGRYAPLWDYANHLLEAQVVAHYADPALNYAATYEIVPGWFLKSNALSTLLLIGLGQIMPIQLAGQLLLSLYVILFLSGLWLLLRRSGTVWPLLLLAPTLAYNFTFTAGFLNFSLGAALSLHALAIFTRWQADRHGRYLLLLALLLLPIYVAHITAWAFLLIAIAALATTEPLQRRRHGSLFLAMNSALPLLLATRPSLAAAAVLIGPILWGAVTVLPGLKVKPLTLTSGAALTVGVAAGLIKFLEPLQKSVLPEVSFGSFDKLTFTIRTFTLPHQFYPWSVLLAAYNLTLAALALVTGTLLAWKFFKQFNKIQNAWFGAIGLFAVLYILIPSRTHDIFYTEPRVLLFAVFLALPAIRPADGKDRLQPMITLSALMLCLVSIVGNLGNAQAYAQKAQAWTAQLEQLLPAQNILVLQPMAGDKTLAPRRLLNTFNSFSSGIHFSNTYAIEHGGFVSRIFDNGPVQPKAEIPIPFYYRSDFSNTAYVTEHCADLRAAYDAALFWGTPSPALSQQLDACFGPGQQLPDMTIWKRR